MKKCFIEDAEGIGQCLLKYEHDGRLTSCGMTFFQCGMSPILIFTDLDNGISITNSIESVASTAFAMHFLHVAPKELLFFEHYPRKTPEADSFFQVKLGWDFRSERFRNPEFSVITREELRHLLSCYGHKIPNIAFKKAGVIPFRPANKMVAC